VERTERFGLILSPMEKRALVLLAEAEGGLSQAAVLRRLIRLAARDKGLAGRCKQHAKDQDGGEVGHGD